MDALDIRIIAAYTANVELINRPLKKPEYAALAKMEPVKTIH